MKSEIDASEWEEMSKEDRYLYLDICFKNSMNSGDALDRASTFPNFGLTLIEFISKYDLENLTRERLDAITAAHYFFRNHLQCQSIVESEKVGIKPILLQMLFTCHNRVIRNYVVNDLLEIANDFPVSWPTFLSDLVSAQDYYRKTHEIYSINGLLAMIEALCTKFRYLPDTHKLLVNHFSGSLEWLFRDTCGVFAPNSDPDLLLSIAPELFEESIESQRLCCKVFLSFMTSGVPRHFRTTMDQWFPQLLHYLRADSFKVKSNTVDVDGLRIAACEVLFLCTTTQHELFSDYVRSLVDAVRSLLVLVVASESSSSRDQLAEIAFRFLCTVKDESIEDWFDRDDRDDALQQMCEKLVLPHVMVRDEDEQLFHKDYDEFIYRDRDNTGPNSSRRIACDLLHVLDTPFVSETAKHVSSYIEAWFDSFSQSLDENWKHKECALYVVISLANKRYDGKAQSAHLIKDFQIFFSSLVIPELQSQCIGEFPMLKARALEFFIMFRFLIPKPTALTLLPDVLRFLNSDSNVVHSYAARCIEVLLRGTGDREFTSADISPYLSEMMQKLLKALEKKGSNQNPYIMRCIVRVLGLADLSVEVAELCLNKLLPIFKNAGSNSTELDFSWNLFESVDILLRKAFKMNFPGIQGYENYLFPSLKMVLDEGSSDFQFYAFNLLCQLVEWHKHSLPTNYIPVFRMLLSQTSYDRADYIQEVQVRLFKSFVENAPPSFLGKVSFTYLGEIYVVLGTRRGFKMLTAVVNNIGIDVLAPYMKDIWGELLYEFSTLAENDKSEFCESFLALMSRFVRKNGPEKFVESIAAFNEEIFPSVIESFWIPNLKLIRCPLERDLSLAASTRLICESDVFLDPLTDRILGGMLDSIVTLLSQSYKDKIEKEVKVGAILSPQQQDIFKEDPEVGHHIFKTYGMTAYDKIYNDRKRKLKIEKEVKVGAIRSRQKQDRFKEDPEVEHHIFETYDMTAYAKIYNDRKRKEEDSLKDKTENAELQVLRLARFYKRFPERCMRLICENLSEENQAAFFKFCASCSGPFDDA